MLHDLRKLVATEGEKLGLSSEVLRRILNHTAPKSDVLHPHYVSLGVTDVVVPLGRIQETLLGLMRNTHQGVYAPFGPLRSQIGCVG
jgi:hypothetical protein